MTLIYIFYNINKQMNNSLFYSLINEIKIKCFIYYNTIIN